MGGLFIYSIYDDGINKARWEDVNANEYFAKILSDSFNYLKDAINSVKPTIISIVSCINYFLFPNSAYVSAATSLGIAVLLDIATKYYAISQKNGGFYKAIRERSLSSESLWEGSKRKLIDYFIILLLCSLTTRVILLDHPVITFLSTIPFIVMFLREFQSIIENLIDAGHDLEWLLYIVKKKKDQILEDNDVVLPEINSPLNKEEEDLHERI